MPATAAQSKAASLLVDAADGGKCAVLCGNPIDARRAVADGSPFRSLRTRLSSRL